MTLKGRILLFLKEQKIKKTDFFDKTGIAASNFKGVGLGSELGGDKIVKILSSYPEISSDWLLKGEGSMLRNNLMKSNSSVTNTGHIGGSVVSGLESNGDITILHGEKRTNLKKTTKREEELIKIITDKDAIITTKDKDISKLKDEKDAIIRTKDEEISSLKDEIIQLLKAQLPSKK